MILAILLLSLLPGTVLIAANRRRPLLAVVVFLQPNAPRTKLALKSSINKPLGDGLRPSPGWFRSGGRNLTSTLNLQRSRRTLFQN